MKKMKNFRNISLAFVLLAVLAVTMVVKAFYPTVNVPQLNIPNMVLISLVAVLLEMWLAAPEKNCWICNCILAVLTFGLLPLAAGFADLNSFWKLGLVGGAVFTLTGLAMDSVRDRLASGPEAKGALMATAFGVYLASQCFAGILL